MEEPKIEVLEKWKVLIDAAKKYWIDSESTGMTDSDFDKLERQAFEEDGFYARDYVLRKYSVGTRTQNKYIDKIKKFKVEGSTMLEAMIKSSEELGIPPEELYCVLKYDGTSIAIYPDPKTGKVKKIVTVGNTNLGSFGIDQTWKLIDHIPKQFPIGITAIQCEAVIDLARFSGDPDKARQKANGLINSKYCEAEVSSLLTLRAYRYFLDDSWEGKENSKVEYPIMLQHGLRAMTSPVDGHITFCAGQVWTLKELMEMPPGFTETDKVKTNTGTFLADGWVLYNKEGVCQRALKFAGAGSGTEAIKTIVHGIQWNDQSPKGKDSWSANVIIDPVVIKGSTIKKPSAGSVAKLINNNITPGAEVGIILANSTIPMVGDVFKAGNGDYQWPTCSCGYKLGKADIYGSLIKCGNVNCSERLKRMKSYLSTVNNIFDLDLNKLLVIDRFRWENTQIDKTVLLGFVQNGDEVGYYNYLDSFLKTDLQKRNLKLVYHTSFEALREKK